MSNHFNKFETAENTGWAFALLREETLFLKRRDTLMGNRLRALLRTSADERLVVELNRELNEARVVAGGSNSSEVSRINDPASIRIKAPRCKNRVEVADG